MIMMSVEYNMPRGRNVAHPPYLAIYEYAATPIGPGTKPKRIRSAVFTLIHNKRQLFPPLTLGDCDHDHISSILDMNSQV